MKNKTLKTFLAILIILLILPFSYSEEDSKSFRFVVLADTQQDEVNAKGKTSPITERITDEITDNIKPSFVINVGDMIGANRDSSNTNVNNGFIAMFKLSERYKSNNIPFFISAGNHDVVPKPEVYSEKIKNYDFGMPLKSKEKSNRYYSFVHENSYFIVLYVPFVYAISDNPNRPDSLKQFNWLKQELEEAKKSDYEHIFIFGHVPVESVAAPLKGKKTCSPTDALGRPPLEKEVVELLSDERIIYFSGHEHVFKDFITKNNVHQVVSGHAGIGGFRCLKGETKYQTNSFVVVDVNGEDVSIYGLTKKYDYKKTIDGIPLPKLSEKNIPSVSTENIIESTKEVLTEKREEEKNLLGIYSIKPSFRTKIDYSLKDYNIIEKANNNLIDFVKECEITSGIEECITEGVKEINMQEDMINNQLTLFDGPCDAEENIKSDFVEDYYVCKESEDENCICLLTLNLDPKHEELPVSIKIRDDINDDIDFEEDSLNVALMKIPAKTLTGLEGEGVTLDESYDITLKEGEHDKKILFYKNEYLYYIKNGKDNNADQCRTNKRTFKFCVRDSKRKYWVYDSKIDDVKQKYLEYKFALAFKDNSPPAPIESLKVNTLPLSEKKVIVSWKESPESDIAGYTILKSKSENKNQIDSGPVLTNSVPFDYVKADPLVERETIIINDKEIIEFENNITSGICDYSGEKLICFSGKEFKNISLGKLYKIKNEKDNFLFYIIETEDDEINYDFSAVAFDTSGNELLILNPILRNVSSFDKLPPAVIENIIITKLSSKNISLEWKSPLFDIDGSELDDLDGFHIYYSNELKTDATNLEPIKTIKVSSMESEELRYSVGLGLNSGYFTVVPFDKYGNEYKRNVLFVG